MTPPDDKTFSHYRIISKLGAGGMGEVYLAEDTRLRRKVALKVLPENVAGDKERLRRFEQEAFAASALNHPNILTIYEFGVEGERHFLAAEFVEGQTLRELTAHGEVFVVREILDIAAQVAAALNAAHAAKIVHRDIKPENIMRRDDGVVKVLDFGLAKLTEKRTETVGSEDATLAQTVGTEPGTIMGTVNYMSPEQARGKETDARSDIWSLGVVLYEMVAGRTPFAGETLSDTLAGILAREPAPLEGAPPELQRIIKKSLQKSRDERYQTIKDFLLDLKDLKRELVFAEELERSHIPSSAQSANVSAAQASENTTAIQPTAVSTRDNFSPQPSSAQYVVGEVRKHKLVSLGIVAALVVTFAAVGYFRFFATRYEAINSIAVLPFVNESGNADNEYLSDGMTESLIGSLSQLPNLSVKARNSVFRYKGKEIDPNKIGQELSVQAVLLGRVIQRGDLLTLSLELVDAKTENVIWSEQYARKQADLVSLQNEIARDVSNKLKIKLSGADEQKVAKNYTQSTEAYQLYLKGRYHWNKRTGADIRKSIVYFQQAIDKDPTYALAYAALAEAYILIPNYTKDSPDEAIPKARAAAMKALEIDETLAEAHTALADVMYEYDWKFAEAEKEFKRAIELNPNYATAHQWYGLYLLVVGRNEEGIAEIKRAQELDPLSLIINSIVGYAYTANRQYDQAIEQLRKTIEMDQNFPRGHQYLAAAYQGKGMFEEAISEFEKHSILNGLPAEEAAKKASELREAYKNFGAKGYWRKQIEFYERRRVSHPDLVPPLSIVASFYSQIGEKEQAFAFLEKAYEKREIDLLRLKLPRYDPIRSDPRFQDLLRRVGLPQ